MQVVGVSMLKKKIGLEVIERNWEADYIYDFYKIPTSIIIPEGCREIGKGVFEGCKELEKVEIPGSVKSIGSWAFDGCESLKKIIIPKSVEEIGFCVFRGCCNTEIIIEMPKGEFNYINPGLFVGCKGIRYVEEETRT